MELKKLQGRYTTARRGHKLLKDKRDELMRQFLDVVREDKELRARVEKALDAYYRGFSVASASGHPGMLMEALICPKKEVSIEVETRNMMSVTVPEFRMSVAGNGAAESFNYGFAFTSGELDESLRELNGIMEDLLRMAELEKKAQLLAEEIERTRRRVNALEYIMMPSYLEAIKSIKMKLDENERGNTTRLMKVKDMMLKEQMAQKGEEVPRADIAAGFTNAAVSSVITKLGMAFDRNPDMQALVLAGGVAANSHLRTALEKFAKKRKISLYMPELCYCGDNAAMIGAAAFFEWDAGNSADVSLNAYAYSV
jgi:V/A-type H+-transporting ATPase subunit D